MSTMQLLIGTTEARPSPDLWNVTNHVKNHINTFFVYVGERSCSHYKYNKGMRYLSHINIEGFCMVICKALVIV
jgi:hypothetical protein